MYINYACAQFLILQNFYGFKVIIALKYVSYAVLLGIEEEITSKPVGKAKAHKGWTIDALVCQRFHPLFLGTTMTVIKW